MHRMRKNKGVLDMNDFTKEELETMRNGIFSSMGSSSLWRIPENDLLVDKIQSMINDYDAQVIEAWHCEKCGHVQ